MPLIKGMNFEEFEGDKKGPKAEKSSSSLIKKDFIDYNELPTEEEIGDSSDESEETQEEDYPEENIENTKTKRKTTQRQPRPEEIASEIIEKARAEAEQYVVQAKLSAKKLLEESKLYCQQASSQAEREGFMLGKEEGVKAGKSELAELMKEAKKTLKNLFEVRNNVLDSAENEIALLALAIAEKIINTKIETDRESVLGNIRLALEKIKGREEVIFRVNPQDIDIVKAHKDEYNKIAEGLKNIEFVADHGVEPGGCIIETNLGNVDARISTQLLAIKMAFEEAGKKDVEYNVPQGD